MSSGETETVLDENCLEFNTDESDEHSLEYVTDKALSKECENVQCNIIVYIHVKIVHVQVKCFQIKKKS